ncbi:helix-turn-helix domain-containing protein [Hafnia sp.]|uniref:helix-turn-helix domain-containing protein n=1 Tax=Hafnia sp. TaxID=1873498 RepID=UPI002FC7F6C0
MDSAISFLHTALCSSAQIEKSMQACIHAIPEDFSCDGIFLNYYRHDIRSIQFIALSSHKAARLKRDLIPIPEYIAEQFEKNQNIGIQLINDLKQDLLTEYVVGRGFRNIKSIILMRMSLDGIRLGAVGFFSYQPQAYATEHVALIEAVRGEFSLLSFITLLQHNLLEPRAKYSVAPSCMPSTFSHSDERFIVSPNNVELSKFYSSLKILACSQSPILIFGEHGVGKKSIASYIREVADEKGVYGILDVRNHQLIYISSTDNTKECIDIDWEDMPDIKYFLPLHGGTLLVYELFSLPKRWQMMVLELMSRYPGVCHVKTISIQTERYSEVLHHNYLSSQYHHHILCLEITLPPLRYRHQDIPLLLTHYLSLKLTHHGANKIPIFSPETKKMLWDYQWPGNISELIHVIENSSISFPGGELICDLPKIKAQGGLLPLEDAMREHIIKALRQANGKISGKNGAAQILGINSNTLYSKIKKLRISAR